MCWREGGREGEEVCAGGRGGEARLTFSVVPFVSSTRSVPVAARKVPIPGGPARVQRERGTKVRTGN